MREHFGPGSHIYDVKRGAVLVVMLGGATRAPNKADIAAALALAATLEE